jgi:hypothetical protein
MYVYLTNLHTLWKLKSSYKDGAFDPIFGKIERIGGVEPVDRTIFFA